MSESEDPFFEFHPLATIRLSSDGHVCKANAAARQLFDWKVSDVRAGALDLAKLIERDAPPDAGSEAERVRVSTRHGQIPMHCWLSWIPEEPMVDVVLLDASQLELPDRDAAFEHVLRQARHWMRSHLQVIGSILALELRAASPDPRRALESSQHRMQAVGRMHDSLFESGPGPRTLVPVFERLGAAVAELHDSLDAETRVQGDEVVMSVARTTELSLVVLEILDAAFRERRAHGSARVRIDVRALPEGRLAIELRGNGIGRNCRSDTLSGRLVTGLIQQLDGSAHVDAERERVLLELPIAGRDH